MTGGGGTAARVGRSRSTVQNLREALWLSWQAAPRLCVGLLAVPLLQSLLVGAQLLLIQRYSQVLLSGQAQPGETARKVVPAVAVLVVCLVALLVMDNLQALGRELLTERMRQTTARRTHRAMGQLELIDFELPETHDRVQRASVADFRPAQVVRGLIAVLAAAVRVVVITAAVIAIEPLLVPMFLALAVPVLVVARLLAGARYAFYAGMTPLERRRMYYHRLLTAREPAAEGRAYDLTAHFGERYDELSTRRLVELRGLLGGQWRRMIGGQFTFAALLVGALGVLGWLFVSGRSDLAGLIAATVGLTQVASMLGGLGWPLSELAESGFFLDDQREFVARANERGTPVRAADPLPPLHTLSVEGVCFSYPSGSRRALEKVSLTVRSGEMIALVGPNGSGKTTLAKVLGTLYQPSDGTVRWNGTDLSTADRAAARARIATVFQDFQTYSETIAENVALGALGRPVDHDRIAASLAAAGFDPGELDPAALLGPEHEGGTALSGGQQQRLAIARALYRDADLLILDEPTSALDARAENGLLAGLREAGRTTILVSHRLANVATADRILVFGAGRVIEEGTHQELMALDGVYRMLYTLQASLYSLGDTELSFTYDSGDRRNGDGR